jgi:hypothetical protein
MDYDEITARLVAIIQNAPEPWNPAEYDRQYDLVMAEAIATGWTQAEIWAEADRRFIAAMEVAIKRLEQEKQNATQNS